MQEKAISKLAVGAMLAACVGLSFQCLSLSRKVDRQGAYIESMHKAFIEIIEKQTDIDNNHTSAINHCIDNTNILIDRVRECQDAVSIKRAAGIDRDTK